jgi:hypothetical protein
MTEPRSPKRSPQSTAYPGPNTVPQAPRRRPSEERAAVAASARTATQLAVVAILIAGVALGLTLWRVLLPAATSSCQTTVWDSQPAANELPQGWSVRGTTFDVNRRTTQFASSDSSADTGTPNVLSTVTCFADGSASDVVSRAQKAARDVGQDVSVRTDLSDGGFEATDASGTIFLEFRRGDIIVDSVGSGGATATDIETVASAYDKALGGDGGAISSPEPVSSDDTGASPGASDDTGASSSPAAPELEKLLPTKVGTYDLVVDSALGDAVLQDDAGSRAIIAALKAEGKGPEALQLAQAYETSQTPPAISIFAFKVAGMDVAKVRQFVLDSWLAASGTGITKTQVSLAGKDYTKVDRGDGGQVDYVRVKDDVVFVVTTADATLAADAAGKLP